MKLWTAGMFLGLIVLPLLLGGAGAEETWTLRRCIDYAIENNPDLQSAEARVDASAYDLDYQKKLFFPRLDVNASTGYFTGEPTSPFSVVRGVTEEGLRSERVSGGFVTAGLSLSAPILKEGVLFSRNAPSINRAASQSSLDKSSFESKKNELIFGVALSFFDLLKNKEDIRAAEEHIKSLKLDYEVAASKFREELISKNDLLVAGVKLSSGEKDLMTYKNLSALLTSTLSIKMGLDAARPISVADDEFPLPLLPTLESLNETAVSSRPEIREQEMRVAIAREDRRQAESQRYPGIDFISTYSVANDYGSRTNSSWSGMVQLNLPVFDFGAIASKVRSREAKVTEEEKRLLTVKGAIVQEVIEAFKNIQNAKYEIALREKMVEQSTENARLVRSRFEQNLTPLSSVLEAEYALFENQKALAQAKFDLRAGYLQLVKATGSRQVLLSR